MGSVSLEERIMDPKKLHMEGRKNSEGVSTQKVSPTKTTSP